MRVFLIRHGETVDNVAGLYAGSRDSALTNHGVQQARRLGEWLAAKKPQITHVFASPLQRASKTASAVASAQRQNSLTVVKVSELVEKDFGFYEGKPSSALSRDSSRPRKSAQSQVPSFVDVESKDSLAKRSDAFLNAHLLPLLLDHDDGRVIVIVSHGILLSNLWKRLLFRLQPKSVTISPETVVSRGQVTLEHLGGWSNTGFLELFIQPVEVESTAAAHVDEVGPPIDAVSSLVDDSASEAKKSGTIVVDASSPPLSTGAPSDVHFPISQSGALGDVGPEKDASGTGAVVDSIDKPAFKRLDGYRITILTIDGKPHLAGLKRTRGGIGRAEHDETQRTMDSFFKRARKE